MKTFALTIALCLGVSVMAQASQPTYAHLYDGLPFEMPIIDRPTFPDREVSITDFGAVGDGKHLNTASFAQGLETLASSGGGTLTIPAGIWLTGPIEFKSNINLHLEEGAILLFSDDKSLYPLTSTSYEGYDCYRCTSPIFGKDLENIAITGSGVIDGNGDAWRFVRRDKMNASQWKKLTGTGGVVVGDTWYPSQQFIDGEKLRKGLGNHSPITLNEANDIKDFFRPVMVKFVSCKNVFIQGVLFQNSPAWNLHPIMCENLIIDGVYLKNPVYAQNSDGMDVESCKNVIIYRTTLDVGDDAICIKSGKDEEGRMRGIPTENVIVRDCRVFEGHGGFVVGSEMSGGVKNISVSDCTFLGTDVGLRFKSNRGRGGVVENIYVNNISMTNISHEALLFDLYYSANGGPKTDIAKVDEGTPQFRNILINEVTSYDSGVPVKFNGLPEMPIDNIRLTNSTMTSRKGGLLSESTNIVFENVDISATSGPALKIKNVSDCRLIGCKFSSPGKESVKYSGSNKNVTVE